MKTSTKVVSGFAILSLSASANAAISLSNIGVSTASSFPSTSISGVNGTLTFQDVLASPSGATIQGPGNAGQGTVGNQGFGEIFNWAGGASTLSAISFIDTGGGGAATYQPFLFNLGTTIFNSTAQTFNPSLQVNLFGTTTVQPNPFGSGNFVELDLSGGDAITLITGDSYAFGLLNNNNQTDLTFLRSGGGSSDPNGIGFTLTGLGATTATTGFSGNNRTAFIGVYTTVAPEPATMTLMGLGALVGVFALRRKH